MKKTSSDLFAALMMIAISSFPEDCLNPNIEISFAALSVAHTFLKKWPNISPCLFTYTNFIPLFTELWEVYLKEERDFFKIINNNKKKSLKGINLMPLTYIR